MRAILIRTNRNYRLLLGASSISNLGDGIAMVAIPWLATLLTHDPLLVSAVAMAQRLPWLLLALPAGVLTDRADRRSLMLRADLARMALTICMLGIVFAKPDIPLAEEGKLTSILLLIMLAFLFGSAEVIRDNAAQTILPAIVDPSDLEHANGQLWTAEQITGQFIGPPFAGALIAVGVALPFGVDASLYALAAGLIWMIALPPRKAVVNLHFRSALPEGLGWMRRNPNILRLAIMLGAINAVFVGGMTVLVLYAQEILNLTPTGYGLLLSFGAFGGVLGGIFAPGWAATLGMRNSLVLSLGCFVLVNLLLGLFGSVAMAGLALFLEAAAGMLWNVVTVSYRQRLIPDELLGRVNSVYRFFGWGAMPFGAIGAGVLVTLFTPIWGKTAALHVPYLFAAAVCTALIVYGLSKLRFD